MRPIQLFSLACLLPLCLSCDDSTTAEDTGDSSVESGDSDLTADAMEGDWTRDTDLFGTVVISFGSDGVYGVEFDSSNPEPEVWGPFELQDGQLVFAADDEGLYACSIAGTYEVSLDEPVLVLTVVEDYCSGRSESVDGTWTRAD